MEQKWNDDLYAVTRNEYATMVKSLKPECRVVKEVHGVDASVTIELWTKKNNIRICGRRYYPDTIEAKETYYIWDIPHPSEMVEPKINRKIILETPQQVQQVFDYINAKNREEKQNG